MQVENISKKIDITVAENPIAKVELTGTMKEARTGDVIRFKAVARNAVGKIVDDAQMKYSFTADPVHSLAPAASGQIEQDGRFVAEKPGLYTITATSGVQSDQMTVKITPRNVRKKSEVAGHGLVKVYTSDLWVWEGVDGRDYAVTGTWGANGEAYFGDVTDPAKMHIIDTVTVDARTVNDVKVSEDGRICVISREGASNRKNGFVVLDVSNPHDVKIVSRYDDGLTGGVHNVFIDNNHVYAVNNGRRYDIIDFTDIKNPKETARYEVPEAGTHNLWVEDDVLYVAYYNGGLRVVDISGELMGDLYRQGREIAFFKPMHRDAVIPNAPMVWGPQPYKGLVYFADMNSGLWAVKLVPLNSGQGTN